MGRYLGSTGMAEHLMAGEHNRSGCGQKEQMARLTGSCMAVEAIPSGDGALVAKSAAVHWRRRLGSAAPTSISIKALLSSDIPLAHSQQSKVPHMASCSFSSHGLVFFDTSAPLSRCNCNSHTAAACGSPKASSRVLFRNDCHQRSFRSCNSPGCAYLFHFSRPVFRAIFASRVMSSRTDIYKSPDLGLAMHIFQLLAPHGSFITRFVSQ